MEKKKTILLGLIGFSIVILLIFSITKLPGLDVVKKESLKSFKIITEVLSDDILFDQNLNMWSLTSKDDSIKFYFGNNEENNFKIEFSIEPFIKQNININSLPNGYKVVDNKIVISQKLNKNFINDSTAYETYKNIIDISRESLKYHAEMDHFSIELPNDNAFEWAKDINNNDKDIVFSLNPEPFIELGINPKEINGWTYAKVPMMKQGKMIEVYKLLKSYNID